MMDQNARQVLITKLSDLIHWDLDAAMAYEQATAAISQAQIIEVLETFQDDHEQHMHDLSAAILYYEGIPPTLAHDIKNFVAFRHGELQIVRGSSDTHAVLTAMRKNETLFVAAYRALFDDPDLPLEVKDIIAHSFEDEQRHLAFINHALSDRLWEVPNRLTSLATPPAGEPPDAWGSDPVF